MTPPLVASLQPFNGQDVVKITMSVIRSRLSLPSKTICGVLELNHPVGLRYFALMWVWV